MEKLRKDKRGITLVALVVTIVILLILAGVSLNLVLSNNGIIKKSEEARDKYSNASVNEQEQLDEVSEWIDKNINGIINWEEILADATANPDNYRHAEQSASNGDIGIGTDGKPVNLDLWKYTVINENEIRLAGDYQGSTFYGPSYQESNVMDGKIIGKVPQYIKINGNSEFYAVTNMHCAFIGCTSLTTAPEIPLSVTDMQYTFYNCTSLKTVPTIPLGVTNMQNTFYNCTSLKTAPTIPSSVISMSHTFQGCIKLQGTIEINANPTSYVGCFNNAATEGTGLVVTGSSTMLDTLIGTKSDTSNITKGQ